MCGLQHVCTMCEAWPTYVCALASAVRSVYPVMACCILAEKPSFDKVLVRGCYAASRDIMRPDLLSFQ